MSPLTIAKVMGAGRVVIGLALLADPARASRAWLGAAADQPGTQVAVRALGVRDAFLGLLVLHVAGRAGVGRRTVGAVALCDAVDLTATLAAARALPTAGVAGTAALAGGSAVAGAWLSSQLD